MLNLFMALLLFASAGLAAKTQGTFRGEVVAAPRGEPASGLIYMMGRDGYVRRVVLARAAVVYDSAVPDRERKQPAQRALIPGTEVRVTALVDANSGEWTASRVEVISNHAARFEDDYGEDGSAPDEVNSQDKTVVNIRTI